MIKKPTKTELYNERLKDKRHYITMYIDPAFFEEAQGVENKLVYLKQTCKDFNVLAREYTKNESFLVMLNLGITHTAADFHYQYREFKKWCEGKGKMSEFYNDLPPGVQTLYKAIRPATRSNFMGFEIDKLLEVLPKLNKSALPVLLYMKARCSQPTVAGGVTNLKAETIAAGLGIHRTSVTKARTILEKQGLIEIIHKSPLSNGEGIIVFTKYQINI